MKSYKLLLAFTLFLAFAFNMKAQYVHERSDQYTPPEDSLVIQKLHHWQDQKFGMLIHWGLYSVCCRNRRIMVYLFGRGRLDSTRQHYGL